MNLDFGDVVFVDVDTQHDFMDEDGALYVPSAESIKGNLEKLTGCAKKKNIPILGSVDAHVPDDPEFRIFPPHCVKGTPGQVKIPETTTENMVILPNVRDESVELGPGKQVILEKSIYSLFDNVNSERIIKSSGRRTFVVYGVATDYCVKAAAEGLLERGYLVYLVEDGIRAVDKKKGEEAVEELKDKGAKLVTTKEIC